LFGDVTICRLVIATPGKGKDMAQINGHFPENGKGCPDWPVNRPEAMTSAPANHHPEGHAFPKGCLVFSGHFKDGGKPRRTGAGPHFIGFTVNFWGITFTAKAIVKLGRRYAPSFCKGDGTPPLKHCDTVSLFMQGMGRGHTTDAPAHDADMFLFSVVFHFSIPNVLDQGKIFTLQLLVYYFGNNLPVPPGQPRSNQGKPKSFSGKLRF